MDAAVHMHMEHSDAYCVNTCACKLGVAQVGRLFLDVISPQIPRAPAWLRLCTDAIHLLCTVRFCSTTGVLATHLLKY